MKIFSNSLNIQLKHLSAYSEFQNETFCSYGILRGVGDCIKSSSNYIYIDNGYLNGSNRQFSKNLHERKFVSNIFDLSGYYRIIKNDLVINNNYQNYNKKR